MSTVISRTFGGLYTRTLARTTFHKGELLSVQRLRGVAVLMVLAVHIEDVGRHFVGWQDYHSWYSMRIGYSAADLFFVISGFIMAYITFSRPFHPASWFISRFFRIYPMYIAASLLVVLMWLYEPRMTMGSGEQSWSRIALSLAAFPQADLPLLFVGWTVEHEILFYGIVFVTASLLGRERLYAVMGGFTLLVFARWAYEQASGTRLWDYHLASPYLLQFAMGVLIHRWHGRLGELGWRGPFAGFVALMCVGAAFSDSGRINHESMLRVVVFGGAYACLLVAALNVEADRRARRIDATRRDALVWVGDASYSLYLTHPFVLGTYGKVFPYVDATGPMVWVLIGLAAATTLLVGLVTHVVVERRVMEWGRVCSGYARRRVPTKEIVS